MVWHRAATDFFLSINPLVIFLLVWSINWAFGCIQIDCFVQNDWVNSISWWRSCDMPESCRTAVIRTLWWEFAGEERMSKSSQRSPREYLVLFCDNYSIINQLYDAESSCSSTLRLFWKHVVDQHHKDTLCYFFFSLICHLSAYYYACIKEIDR